jgi:hypothetical protein
MYKVIYKDIIIDVIKRPMYCMYFSDGQKLLTDETSANCIISSKGDETYHLAGRSPFMPESYKTVELVRIDKQEYDYLKSLTTTEEAIEFNLNDIRATKTAEMSAMSEQTIHEGTDITLSDGNSYHFSFSDQDQLLISFLTTAAKNAAMLESMNLPTNETGKDYPWHADSSDCIFYSREDMITIGTTMHNYITYHNSYFHALRNYIDALTNPLVIVEIKYGMEVPKMYWGEVYNYANS